MTCPVCKDRRFLAYDVPVGHPLFSKTIACDCQRAIAARDAIHTYGFDTGEYEHMTFAGYSGRTPEQRRCKVSLEATATNWRGGATSGAILYGGVGLGKTHLGIAALRVAAEAGFSVAVWTMPNLFDKLIDAYATQGGEAATLRHTWESVDALLLDDVGAERRKGDMVERVYFGILDVRNTRQKRTVVTTNLSLDSLEGYIGERAADRLMVLCPQPLNLGTGPSYRQLQAGLLDIDP